MPAWLYLEVKSDPQCCAGSDRDGFGNEIALNEVCGWGRDCRPRARYRKQPQYDQPRYKGEYRHSLEARRDSHPRSVTIRCADTYSSTNGLDPSALPAAPPLPNIAMVDTRY